MALPGNGIFVVKGEMCIVMTAMRRGVRWSSHSHQDEELDALMRSFQELKEILNRIEDLRKIEPKVFLNPFLEIIRSEETTGPVTSLALSAINKFLSYGMIDPTQNTIPEIVDNIADAVTHARFVGTDQASDGVVLMKILQVLRTLTLSPEGATLTNNALCEIMLSCFRICFETRLNELLRRTAEHYLKDMVQLVFMRLPQFPEDLRVGAMKQLKMKPGSIDQTRTKRKRKSKLKNDVSEEKTDDMQTPATVKSAITLKPNPLSTTPLTPAGNIVDMQGTISQTPQSEVSSLNSPYTENCTEHNILITVQSPNENEEEIVEDEKQVESPQTVNNEDYQEEYVNPRGIRFTPQSQDSLTLVPYGLLSVREMFRFLISLCNPLDKQNTDAMIHLGLTLLTVAFEVGADNIGKYNSLLALVKDDLCRNLFSLLSTERLSVFAADLQVSFLMFESLRTHLKFQLEFYLTKLVEIITSDSLKITYEHKEISLDNIVQLWRIPGLVTELYLNYDCDMYCTNLYEDLTKLLAKNAFPAATGVYHTHLLSLDALLTVIEAIETHCKERIKAKSDSVNANEVKDVSEENEEKIEHIDDFIGKSLRQKVSQNVPTREDLSALKNIKRWLPTGTDYFNQKPKKGIQFFQEHGVLKPELDPQEVVVFLRENPGLDKAMIGEYICNRNNMQVLEAFVKMFDFTDLRIDEALRQYLETFRLPGEAPLISLLLEHFAEHWHKCNGEPFANADAAFTLAYAIIMLNVDQHNHNVKKQSILMTVDDFKKNLKKVNGGNDFDQDMLDDIYNAIKNEEIVMPAEHTGLVRENYLWKVLLRRGLSKDGTYIHVSDDRFDRDLFGLIWGPIVAALSFVFDKSEDALTYARALKGFESCAFVSSYFGASHNLDMLILTLCKFTNFHNQSKTLVATQFGANPKAQSALKAVFSLSQQHGSTVREGWKNIFDLFLSLYNNKLLPKYFMEAEDFTEPSGKISLIYEITQSQKQDTGLFSSLYSYMVSSENLSKIPSSEEQQLLDMAKKCIKECNLDSVITESKFISEESLLELTKALVELSRGPDLQKSLGYSYNEHVAVFFLELLIRIVLQNKDRVLCIWQIVRDHLYTLVMNASHCDYQYLLERSVIGLLRLAIRLMRNEDMSPIVLQSLRMLLLLKSSTLFRISRQISYGLYELLKTSAQNIHTNTDWSIIFTLLECVGAGAHPPKPVSDDQGAKSEGEAPGSSEDEAISTDRGYTSDSELTRTPKRAASVRPQSPVILASTSPSSVPNSTSGWILVGNEGEVQPVVGRTCPAEQYSLALENNLGASDPIALVKCCESLAFLVRDVAHITPYNFDNCVHCIRTFIEASLHGGRKIKKSSSRDNRNHRKASGKRRDFQMKRRSPNSSSPDENETDEDELPSGYQQISMQLLDLTHTLHIRTAQIFRWWAEEGGEVAQEISLWTQGWCPLLQGIARLCCDCRKQIRMSAITYLQRALLVHDLQTLSGPEWEACFQRVLFPLLSQLLQPIGPKDPHVMEETRMRAATVLSKVFLHHLTPLLTLPTFASLWITILDFMDKYMHADNSDLLSEAIPESLKNMLLVMDSADVFEETDGQKRLWSITWERISRFLPNLKSELFKEDSEENTQINEDTNVRSSPTASIQHNIENATRSSIILQPPSSESNIASPLFAHLGQMVSTPIGAPTTTYTNYNSPIIQPQLEAAPLYVPPKQEHQFPVLYNSPLIPTTPQPLSLYNEYMVNPYNSQTEDVKETPISSVRETIEESNMFNENANLQTNLFQSSNYFSSGNNSDCIPPGSEILYTNNLTQNFNIPDVKTTIS